MGEHKRNPTAQLAKDGKLPPKPPKKSKREIDREIQMAVYSKLDSMLTYDAFSCLNYTSQKLHTI